MIQQLWGHENRKTLVCMDSYENGVLKGRFYTPLRGMEVFNSLSQFLVRMESVLEESRVPQSYTVSRSFSTVLPMEAPDAAPERIRQGAKATFELQILFRQHSSWQGMIIWREKKTEQSFRSVLELVLLMDSALRSMEGCEAI